ncbi:M1 family metallopeptidase [Deinococcus metallilatus]|uniref:Aminopeptidase N n=1 Tax=Deinococcus metallilatus TaxID=1211322 RepID=A0ABR6MSA7_9DEIO|nr:M1 family metallopeptidase [Deinococcus metallilatus]MBB5294794.1 aminopeptidase N [Deinococcus metallilatus]GMA16720.1 zinc metalloprotease [Deinococcus metallilatus]
MPRSTVLPGLLILAGVLAGGPPAPAQPLPTPPPVSAGAARTLNDPIFPGLGQLGLDVRHYDVALTVAEPGTPELSGAVTLTLVATRPLAEVRLDFFGPTVTAVRWNGQAAPFRMEPDTQKLVVTPPAPLLPGQEARLTVEYQGTPGVILDPDFSTPLRLGWQAVPAGEGGAGANFTLSEPQGTHTFLPTNDHPSDKATFTTRVTVPPGFTAAASGLEGAVVEGSGTRTFVFTQAEPIPTYALAVHVNRFERVTAPPVPVGANGAPVVRRDYFPVGTPDSTRSAYALTDEMLRVLSGWFGPYPFGAYGVAVVTPPLPALETATLSTMPVRSSNERVAVHELAHQWFGDAVTPATWADVWLNEGFATYAELLWTEAQGGDGQAVAAHWYAILAQGGTRSLVATQAGQLFDRSAYQRGALALHALRAAVGDAAFRAFLHAYTARFSGKALTTADLLAFAHAQVGGAGEAALRTWVESPGLPPLPVPSH